MNNPESSKLLPKSKFLQKKEKLQELTELERKIELKQGLPHLHGYKWYRWAREFFESTSKENFLVAANQISKSSTQIRKCIEWATNPLLWPSLWPGQKPNQFWYLYPNRDTADAEFETKWKLFLPSGKYKDDPQYGWKVIKERNQVKSIIFNSGVVVYFKTYAQDTKNLQAGTVYAIFCDEELPIEHLAELKNRLNATDGYFHMVFTATLGQDFWRRTMEPYESETEECLSARKWQISMYDCMHYEDGTPSYWTEEKIERAKRNCPTKAEIQRRIFGRFVVSGGLMFESFEYEKNTCDPFPIPEHWHIYCGVDIGSGGLEGHPAAIVFIAVAPDFRKGVVFRGWRGDGIQTESGVILLKYRELRGRFKITSAYYDWESKEFEMIATRNSEPFQAADKSRGPGIATLNLLFKHGMLKIFRGDIELEKLTTELSNLLESTAKSKAKDDLCDALRYGTIRIPWDYTAIEYLDQEVQPGIMVTQPERTIDELRMENQLGRGGREINEIEEELEFWNDLYEG